MVHKHRIISLIYGIRFGGLAFQLVRFSFQLPLDTGTEMIVFVPGMIVVLGEGEASMPFLLPKILVL